MMTNLVFMGVGGTFLALVLAVCLPPAATSAAPPSAKSSTLEALIEGARSEGELKLVSANILGGKKAVERWTEGLNKKYGLNIKVTYTPGPPMAQLANRIVQEYRANRPAMTDLTALAALDVQILLEGNALEAVNWMHWANNIQRVTEAVALNGEAVAVTTHTPGITYNSQKLTGDNIPKSMRDLLKPYYKGKLASTPYSTFMAFASGPHIWGRERAFDYQRKLAQQVGGLIRCSELDRIITGEFDVFGMDCGSSHQLRFRARGAPLDQVMASDLPLLQYFYYSVPKNAAHPNAAKLWVNYVLSKEGQEILYETDFSDLHLIEGSQTGRVLDEIKARGVQLKAADIHAVQRIGPQTIRTNLSELNAIIRRN